MARRAFTIAAAASIISLEALTPGASSAVAEGDESPAVVCLWGGTPVATTGTFTVKPGLTHTPAAADLKFVATGPVECSNGHTGKATLDGVVHAGSTCAVSTFEGKITGLPGVERAFGVGPAGTLTHLFYDGDDNIVGTDQGQVLSGANQGGSEASDCGTEEGFTDGSYSTVVELWASAREVTVCHWGGTPDAATGTVTFKPGLTTTPSATDGKVLATGDMECNDGFSGKVVFDGVVHSGSTCATQMFSGKVKGIPGVEYLEGPGAAGLVHEFLYDKDGNIVGSDQPQVYSGIGRGSEASDCNTTEGFTEAIFSSTVELWG